MYRIRENFAFTLPYSVYWVEKDGSEYLESESFSKSDAYDYVAEQEDYSGDIEFIGSKVQ